MHHKQNATHKEDINKLIHIVISYYVSVQQPDTTQVKLL